MRLMLQRKGHPNPIIWERRRNTCPSQLVNNYPKYSQKSVQKNKCKRYVHIRKHLLLI